MKTLVRELLYYTMIGTLGYMFYTGNYTYLNLVDIGYILILLLSTVVSVLLSLIYIAGYKDEKVRKAMLKTQETFAKGKLKTLYYYAKLILTTVALAMTGHTFLVVWYLSTTAMVIGMLKLTDHLLTLEGE